MSLDVSSRVAVLAPATVTRLGGNNWFATTMAQRHLTGSQRRTGAHWGKECKPIGVVRRAAQQIKHRARSAGGAILRASMSAFKKILDDSELYFANHIEVIR